MSSLEIAELTGKRHGNVMADIRTMLEGLGLPELSFQSGYKDQNNQQRAAFNLPRDLTETLITGYSIPLRHKVVVRLRELESEKTKPQFQVPTTLHGALLLAAELEGQQAALTHQVEIQVIKIAKDSPKVETQK
jgi:phage regulator Rha-like protein